MARSSSEYADDEKTTIDGANRDNGTAEVLKVNGWRWSRTFGSWYVPHSRNVPPKHSTTDRAVAALEADGFSVAVSIDATRSDREAVQARRVQDVAARADRLDERAQCYEKRRPTATPQRAASRTASLWVSPFGGAP